MRSTEEMEKELLSARIAKVEAPIKSKMDYMKSVALGDDKDEVSCKLCGNVIMNEKDIKGKTRLVPNAMYAEITIEFKDGSAHETSICKTCSKKDLTDNLEFIYMSDMKQWERESDGKFDLEIWNKEIKSYKVGSRIM